MDGYNSTLSAKGKEMKGISKISVRDRYLRTGSAIAGWDDR